MTLNDRSPSNNDGYVITNNYLTENWYAIPINTVDEYQSREKEYTGTIRLGETTPSYDMEKAVDAHYPTDHITEEMVRAAAASFIGEQQQVPPQFSAVRIAGRRAFSYARQGEDVEITPRSITISEFEITRCELPDVDFRIVCSKGTYIRSIARDFGLARLTSHISIYASVSRTEFLS